MGFDELSTRLWRERCVLELLRFKLAEEHLILASGHHAWLDRATAEVEQVVEMLELADTEREEAVAAVGQELGLGATPTLAQLVATAPEPWNDILAGHRQAMVDHFDEIEKVSAANREILAHGRHGRRLVLFGCAARRGLCGLGCADPPYAQRRAAGERHRLIVRDLIVRETRAMRERGMGV
jgi:FlgN protein